jgi:hypothetical protein
MTIFTTYRKARLVVFPKVGERFIKVRFTPTALFGNVGFAEYVANDKALVDALKAHPSFGVEFFVKEEFADVEEATVVAEPTKKEVDYRDLCDATKPIIEEDSVVDIATANNWLQREHSAVFKGKRADTIKSEAATIYNTVFPNWK